MKTPSDQILLFLKTRGPSFTGQVALDLEVSRQAARVHLEKLAAQDLIACVSEASGVGRPKQVWSLTSTGHARFPDSHAQMTVELIGAIREEFGETGLERLIAKRERATAQTYQQVVGRDVDIKIRLERLARLRADEGYLASWQSQGDGSYLLIEDHCPICAAAKVCQGFCRSELALFETILAPAKVERVEHLLSGARRCAYRISPA